MRERLVFSLLLHCGFGFAGWRFGNFSEKRDGEADTGWWVHGGGFMYIRMHCASGHCYGSALPSFTLMVVGGGRNQPWGYTTLYGLFAC